MSLKKQLPPQVLAEMVNPPQCRSFGSIAREFGKSRQRVHQIYKEYKEKYPELFKEKEIPEGEVIKEALDRGDSYTKIMQDFNLTTTELKKILEKHGLKKKLVKDILTKERLMELYVDKELDDEAIGKMFNCSPNTVMRARYEHGIYKEMRRPLREKLTPELFKKLYVDERVKGVQLAELFNTNIANILELKKEYGIKRMRAKGVSEERLSEIKEELKKQGVVL